MEVKVLDFNGKDTGRKVQLSDSVFMNQTITHILMLSNILLINDKERTKLKKELKLREVHVRLKTKGTGTARAGSAKNPLLKVVEQFSDQDQEVIQIEKT
jgi:large subunit ribosomal protein L4